MYVTRFEKTHVMMHDNFEQTLTFKHSLFGHFIQQANTIWYKGGALTGLPRYKI